MTGRRRKPGRMGPFIEGYRAWLAGRGYTPGTIVNMLAMAGGLGRWMDARGIAPGDLDRAVVTEFRDALRAAGMRCVPGAHGLDPLLEYLEGQGVLGGASSPAAPVEVLAERYRRWLVTDRGLAEATVVRYVKLARLFLSAASDRAGGLESLSGTDVVAFLLAESERLSVGSVKGRVGELRSLLRFLYLQGLTPRPLAAVVPPVAGWRDTGVPKAIPAGDVQRLLDSCDRGDPIGIRDYAILMLVARLGLRSAEVSRLELGDIDWRAGQITLRGKACRQDGMPLPCDVGEALAAYLSQARPATPLRQVFLAAKAPMRAIPPGLVSDVTHRACDRAGLPRIGAHRLRHTLATEMLRRGAHDHRGEPGAAASRSGHHRHLRQGGLRRLAHGCPALAGSGAMSALADAARDYLRLRNSLGHDLAEYHRELPRFVAFLEAEGLPTVTVAAALAWAQGPGVDPATSIAPRRMTIARGFARYLAGVDARTEVPPPGLIAGRHRWRPPFIYSPGDIEALMAQARRLTPMPAATHETLVGLLAVTGLRVGEAIRLDRADIDWTERRADDPGVEVRQDPHGARP